MTVVVSLGTAAFTAGGGDPGPGPKITPQMELYSEEHAITTGEVPFTGAPGTPEQVEGGMVSVGSATAPSRATTPTALDSGRPAQKP